MLTYDPSTAENTALAVFNQGKDAKQDWKVFQSHRQR